MPPDQRPSERGIVAGVHELVEQLCIGLIADMASPNGSEETLKGIAQSAGHDSAPPG